jgi:hypothetical protein
MLSSTARLRRGFGSSLALWLAGAMSAGEPLLAADGSGPRLFLNCTAECFEPFLRQELSHFDLVRDRHQASFEVLISAQPAGSGGVAYRVTAFRRDHGARPSSVRGAPTQSSPRGSEVPAVAPSASRQVTRRPGQAEADFRAALLDGVLRLLYATMIGTPHESRFQLRLPRRSGQELERLPDPWDYWVLMPELEGEGEAGSGYHFAELGGNVTIRRITDRHKLRLKLSYWRALSSFEFEDGSSISGDVYGIASNGVYARSLGERSAIGLTGNVRSSEFENLELHAHYGPVFEVNLFPYTENASRQLRLSYQIGVWYNDYIERSAERELSELRYYHAATAVADVNQAWGSVQVAAQLNSFLRQPSQFRLALGGQLALLLFEGFSLQFEGTSAWVRDQINARERPLEDSEVLLFIAEQPTRFTLEATFGFSYTFGSVHNTIVNPRFGRIDLEED